MRIRITQSGGYAGIPIPLADVDTATLSPARAERVQGLVRESGFFDLPAHVDAPSRGVGADIDVRHEITIDDGARSHTVSVGGAADTALGTLLAELKE